MSAVISIKNSQVAGRTPPSLALGEIAINVPDGKIFVGDGSGVKVLSVSGSGGSGGTVTSVQLTQGTGINLSGTNPITTTGNITVTNSDPGSALNLTNGAGITIGGTYPNYTITNTINASTFLSASSFNNWTGSVNSQFAGTASFATSASYSATASYALFALSSSNATNAATTSNILGGKATHIPFFITDTTLATSSIYQSGSSTVIINQDNATSANPEALYVYQPSQTSFNVISGKGNLNNYLQLNIQNTNQGTNASSDVVATAGNGNETTNYIDMGINSDNFIGDIGGPNDAYIYSTGQNLHIGNATAGQPVQFFAGGIDVEANKKLELNANGQHNITGSLTVTQGVTASLYGNATTSTNASTASYVLTAQTASYVAGANVIGAVANATSASHADQADNASTADYASIAGNGGVTNIVAGSGITLIPTSGVGAVTVISSGGGGVTIISGSNVTQSFNNTATWTFNHDLGTRWPIITVFDTNYKQIIPQDIELVNTSSAIITFPTAESGFAVASLGGATGTVYSSSYSLFSTYAATASNYAETDPVFVAKSASLATTGSNTFRGTQTVTGSLFTTGSNTLIGSTTLTGSLNITGSTTQTGNNTLIGNTVLSGSIGISGSSTIQGTTTMSGSLSISGSTTQTGNNTLIGTTTLTGSINIVGDIIPTISSSFSIGSVTNPWKDIWIKSASLNIASDIPGVSGTSISNVGGNLLISAGGIQLVGSGSFNAATGSFGYISGSLTQVGNNTVTGSVISTSGFTGSLYGTASWANNALTASYAPSYLSFSQTGSFAITGSNRFNGNQTISGSLLVSGSTTHTGSVNISGSLTVNGPTLFNDLTVTITGSLLVTGSTTHRGDITISTGSIIMDGTAQSLVLRASATNPAALAIHTFSTASYHGASYMFTATEDSTGKSTTYNVLVATGNNRVANIQTYLIKSEGSSPNPTVATAINAGNIELRVTDTGTFTYRGIVQLF